MFSLECLYSGLIIVFTKIFFRIKLPNFIYKLCIFIYSTSFVFPLLHKCRFWQDDRGFFPYQCFFLTGCHCLSAHGNKSFSICHFYLSLHLLLILHCFLPPCFPPQVLSFSYLFGLFFNQTSALFKTFWRV